MIYLDNNATTKPSTRVVEAMLPYLGERYFNASASTVAFTGADKPRAGAAAAMAMLLNAEEPECFAFTSGATESNNWVFAAVARGLERGRVIVSAIEHPSVSDSAAALAERGFEVLEIPVDRDGRIRVDALEAALSPDVLVVSIMAANNETGVLQPIERLGRLVRERSPRALFHTDATQAVGKTPIDLRSAWEEIDLVSFSAHKFHGPKGVGGLYIRPGVKLEPMLRGGGQEAGLRSGTTNTAGLAGLAAAAGEVDVPRMNEVARLRDQFEDHVVRMGVSAPYSRNAPRLPNTSCFSVPGQVGEDLVQAFAARGVIVGTGAACSAGAMRPPKTILALGVDYATAAGSLRVSLSRYTTEAELRSFTTLLMGAVRNSAALHSV